MFFVPWQDITRDGGGGGSRAAGASDVHVDMSAVRGGAPSHAHQARTAVLGWGGRDGVSGLQPQQKSAINERSSHDSTFFCRTFSSATRVQIATVLVLVLVLVELRVSFFFFFFFEIYFFQI